MSRSAEFNLLFTTILISSSFVVATDSHCSLHCVRCRFRRWRSAQQFFGFVRYRPKKTQSGWSSSCLFRSTTQLLKK
ncbi:uncharacterized protein V1513DRAFT_438687 [Lipomyces chichibuensis]|uniref:uncharacterized protein n=1 Tax=Lipomyces chichibuensis TaxID=1546026 RepID=UPI0033440787